MVSAPAPVFAKQSLADGRAQEAWVTMADGVRLATDVYLPGEGSGPAPTVLIRLPYDKTGRYTFIPQIGEHFAAHGFVCVTQDVRGKYRSGGDRSPFVHEASDGWDTVEWITGQPWSDGVVGTWGIPTTASPNGLWPTVGTPRTAPWCPGSPGTGSST